MEGGSTIQVNRQQYERNDNETSGNLSGNAGLVAYRNTI